jgi:ketosteroid isomerase-like protein
VSENYDRLFAAIESWNRGDLETALEAASEDVRWYPGDIFPDSDELYVGKQGIRDFFTSFEEPWEWVTVDHLERRELGDRIVVRARFRARSHEGVEVDLEVGQLWTFGGGQLTEFRAYPSYEEALAAAQ